MQSEDTPIPAAPKRIGEHRDPVALARSVVPHPGRNSPSLTAPITATGTMITSRKPRFTAPSRRPTPPKSDDDAIRHRVTTGCCPSRLGETITAARRRTRSSAVPAADRLDSPPTGIQSQRSGPRHSRLA
jgi:hypothetical protein